MTREAERSDNGSGDDVIEVPRGELLRLSFLLGELAQAGDAPDANDRRRSRVELVAHARATIQRRQARADYFATAILGEPAWDLLLLLYVADGVGEVITVNAAGERAGLAATSAKRWIEYLEKERLMRRAPHPHDGRRIVLTLSDKGRSALDTYFSGVIGSERER